MSGENSECPYPYISEVETALCTKESLEDKVNESIIRFGDIVRRVIYHKLNKYGYQHNDAEDLFQSISLKLVVGLLARKDILNASDNNVIGRYIATIASNACNDYLRSIYPERRRLKDKIYDLVKRHPDYQFWTIDENVLCGLKKWDGSAEGVTAKFMITHFEALGSIPQCDGIDLAKFTNSRLSVLVKELFDWLNGGIEIDHLVSIVGTLQNIKELTFVPIDDSNIKSNGIIAPSNFAYEQIELKETLHKLWNGILSLSDNYRKTLLLTCIDGSGDSILHRLVYEQIAPISTITSILDVSTDELVLLLDGLPLGIREMAMFLGTTDKKIYQCRYSGLKKLQKFLMNDLV